MKKKKSTAEDLIDSLLDDSSDAKPSAKPQSAQPPPLPPHIASMPLSQSPNKPLKSKELSEETFAKSVRFEFDIPDAADDSLRLVGDRTHMHARIAKPAAAPTVPPVVVLSSPERDAEASKSEASALSPSDVRNAPTLVLNRAKTETSDFEPDVSFQTDPPVPEGAGDKTVRISEPKKEAKKAVAPVADRGGADRPVDRHAGTEVRFGIGQMGGHAAISKATLPPSGAVFTSAEASLKQSESLRIAQTRIHELEQELDRVRRENEKLASAGETLRRRTDELLARTEILETQTRESQKIHDEEKKVLRGQLAAKEREGVELRAKLEEMESRLEGNFKRIRVRERELEHRLEIVKMESATLVSTKDEMIMRLKREIDQLKFETDNGKVRSQELYNQYREKQETIGRVVRALRIALTILEGDEDGQKNNDE